MKRILVNLISIHSLLLVLTLVIAAPPLHGQDDDAYTQQVQQMYLAYYGRPGDPGGVTYWSGRLAEAGGNWITDLVNAFGTSQEYTERFSGVSQEGLITGLYQRLFNRPPDDLGLAFYVDLLNGSNNTGFNPEGRVSTLAQLALDIANGAVGTDGDIIDNKLRVAGYFTDSIESTDTPYTAEDIDDAVAILADVTDSEESVTLGLTASSTFMRLRPFEHAEILIHGEEIVLIGAGPDAGGPGVALDLPGGPNSGIVSADISPDGLTVWVITTDQDNGTRFFIMDRSGINVVEKALPAIDGGWPEVAIADKYGAFGFISIPFVADEKRHWRFYSTTWHNDTGLLLKLDTFEAAENDPTFNPEFGEQAVGLRAVDGVEGFYFLNGGEVMVSNESSPGRPIRVGRASDLLWNGDPPDPSAHWRGLDVGGGRWFSILQIAPTQQAVIGGALVGTVFNLQYVTPNDAELVVTGSEISDDGDYITYCLNRTDRTAPRFSCYTGEYGGTAFNIGPAHPDWWIQRLGISGAGNRIWGQEAGFSTPQYTFVANPDKSLAFRAGVILERYDTPRLDQDGDTMLARSQYGFIVRSEGLTLLSYGPGLLSGPMPGMRDFRYRLTESLLQLDVAGDENVDYITVQIFRDGYFDPAWHPAPSTYPWWARTLDGRTLTQGDDGRYFIDIPLFDEVRPNDRVRLEAFNNARNRVSFMDAFIKPSHF